MGINSCRWLTDDTIDGTEQCAWPSTESSTVIVNVSSDTVDTHATNYRQLQSVRRCRSPSDAQNPNASCISIGQARHGDLNVHISTDSIRQV